MGAKEVFGEVFKPAKTDRAMEERTLEGLLSTFAAEPDEAEALCAAVLGRMLDDELVAAMFQKLKWALQTYARRNFQEEVDEARAWHEARARREGE